MKLSWRLFFMITSLLVTVLTVFGVWMVGQSFSDNLAGAKARCETENTNLISTYTASRITYLTVFAQEPDVADLMSTYRTPLTQDVGCCRIYKDTEEIYADNALTVQTELLSLVPEAGDRASQVCRQAGRYYAVTLTRIDGSIAMETIYDITSVYEMRQAQYVRYQWGIAITALVTGLLTWLILQLTLRRVTKLSRATQKFAAGSLGVRVKPRSNDEITELTRSFNRMADTISDQMTKLRDEARRQEQFTSSFAHELKTPLTAMIGYADMLRSMDLSPEEIRTCGAYIYAQSRRLQALSQKLLELAMADNVQTPLVPLSCRQLGQEVARVEQANLADLDLRLECRVGPGKVLGDRELLSSLLINLIDNAAKASSPGQSILLAGRATKEGYIFLVQDSGIGIPEEDLPRLTEAFYMVDKSRSRKAGGAGIGLALCAKIVQVHKATLDIRSEPGKGTVVCVRFPKEVAP